MSATEDRTSGRNEAESVACAPGALFPLPLATASKGSSGEVSSGLPCSSADTLTAEPTVSDGDIEPIHLPNGHARVPVVVGVVKGMYYVQRNKVMYAGRELTPTQFESAGGREASRKWRLTLRVLLPDGTAGKRLGLWLREHGFDTRPPKQKRKRDLAAAVALGVPPGAWAGRLCASEPCSPARGASLSPTKSARIESSAYLQSLPSSPCCPHCQHGPPQQVLHHSIMGCGSSSGGGGSQCLAQQHPAAAAHHHAQQQQQHPPRPADIKQSLEAFLASLPPSAQAALGSAVGAGAQQQHYRHTQPALPAWHRHQGMANPAAQPPSTGPQTLGPGSLLSPLSTLRSTFQSLARQQPQHPEAPTSTAAMHSYAAGQHQPAGSAPPPSFHPPHHQQQHYSHPPVHHSQQQQQPQPMQHAGQERWWAPPTGDAAHYLKSDRPLVLPRQRERRRQRPAPRGPAMPSYLLRASMAAQQHGSSPAVELPPFSLEGCTPVLPQGWEECAGDGELAGDSPPLPPSPAALPVVSATQDRHHPVGAGPQPPYDLPQGSAPPHQSTGLSPTPSHGSALPPGGYGRPPGGEGEAQGTASRTPAPPAQQHLQRAEEEGAGSSPELDLEWLLDAGDMDLSTLLGHLDSPLHPHHHAPAASLAAAAAAATMQQHQHHLQGLSGTLTTPLHVHLGGGGGGVTPMEGVQEADLLADLLYTMLPSPTEPCGSRQLPSPHYQQPGLPALPGAAWGADSRQQQQQQAGASIGGGAHHQWREGGEASWQDKGAAGAASGGNPAPAIAAEGGFKPCLPSVGSSFNLKVFAGVPPSDVPAPPGPAPLMGPSAAQALNPSLFLGAH